MSRVYQSPAAQRHGEQMAGRAAEAERRRQPREDWTGLTAEEFRQLSGEERNRLFAADEDLYRQVQGEGRP